jgi:hypothetical protein
MPANQDPEIYSFLKWAAAGLLSIVIFLISSFAVRILNQIKKNIEDLFNLGHKNSEEIVRLETLLDERTGKNNHGKQ